MSEIPHSFSDASVKEICQEVLDASDAGETMESTTKKETVAWAEKNVYKDSNTVFVGLNGGRDKTYIKRAAFENLSVYGQGLMPKNVGYTDGIPANQVIKQRESVAKGADQINDDFEAAFQLRMKIGPTFKFMDLAGFKPQILHVEDPDHLV